MKRSFRAWVHRKLGEIRKAIFHRSHPEPPPTENIHTRFFQARERLGGWKAIIKRAVWFPLQHFSAPPTTEHIHVKFLQARKRPGGWKSIIRRGVWTPLFHVSPPPPPNVNINVIRFATRKRVAYARPGICSVSFFPSFSHTGIAPSSIFTSWVSVRISDSIRGVGA